jgi:uncharacterized protein (DUF983 family)
MGRLSNSFIGHTFFCPQCGDGYEAGWLFRKRLCPKCHKKLVFSGYALLLFAILANASISLFATFFVDENGNANWWFAIAMGAFVYFFGFAILRWMQRAKIKGV